MKNSKFSILIIAALCAFGLVACQPDVDVMGGCDKITVNSIKGEQSLSLTEGLKMTVIEYKFLENGQGVFVQREFGNGVKTAEETYKFVYALEEYGNHNVSRTVSIDAGENGKHDFLWKDGVLYDDQNRGLKAAGLEENFKKVVKNLPNTAWAFHDTVLWIDTTTLDSLKFYTKNVKDTVYGADGKPLINSNGKDSFIIVKKEFVDTVYYDVYDTVGNKSTLDIEIALNKDAKHDNIGFYQYGYKEYDHELNLIKDSVVLFNYHWGLSSVTSAKKFVVTAVKDVENDTVIFEISKFDKAKKTLTLDEKDFDLK